MTDTVIPNGGVTDDQTPEIRISLDAPLWDGLTLRIFRDGVDIGEAVPINSTDFSFTDNVSNGEYVYTAKVVAAGSQSTSNAFNLSVISAELQPQGIVITEIIDDDEDLTVTITEIIDDDEDAAALLAVPTITGVFGSIP